LRFLRGNDLYNVFLQVRHLTKNQMVMFLQRDSDGPAGAVLKYPFVTKMENGTFAAHYKKGFRWGIGGYW
jgi:hypothetical protein